MFCQICCSVSGCTDYYAETEQDGFQIGRDVVAGFNLPNPPGPLTDPCDPLFDPEELNGLIPSSDQHTMDVLQVKYIRRRDKVRI